MCAILPPEPMRYESVALPVSSTEIKLLDLVDDGYLASNTPPKERLAFVDPQYAMAAILVTSRRLHHRSFWPSWIPFQFSHLPRTLWSCQRRRPHPRISHSVRNHSGVHYYDAPSPSELELGLWLGWAKGKRLHAFTSTAAPHQLSIRTTTMPLVEVPRTPLPPPKLVWRLQVENSSIPALKSWSNIPVPFICYPLFKLSFKFFLGLFLG